MNLKKENIIDLYVRLWETEFNDNRFDNEVVEKKLLMPLYDVFGMFPFYLLEDEEE